jgi:hypothetical protein
VLLAAALFGSRSIATWPWLNRYQSRVMFSFISPLLIRLSLDCSFRSHGPYWGC